MSVEQNQNQMINLYKKLYTLIGNTIEYKAAKDIENFFNIYNRNNNIIVDTSESVILAITRIQDDIIKICEVNLYELQKNNPKIAAMEFTDWQKYNKDFFINIHKLQTLDNQQYVDWIYATYYKQHFYGLLNKTIDSEMQKKINAQSPVNINDIYKLLLNYTYKAEETEIANHMEINKHLQDIHDLLVKLTTSQVIQPVVAASS
jgi:hypothetical protein